MNSITFIQILFVICNVFLFVQNLPLKFSGKNENIEELSGKFEGDIVLTGVQEDYIFGMSRNGLLNVTKRWINKTVPYELSVNHTDEQNDHIEKALKEISSISCLTFVRRTNETDYIKLQAEDSGCWSHVGRIGDVQTLNLKSYPLDNGCFRIGTIMHEFLHGKFENNVFIGQTFHYQFLLSM